MFKRAVLGILLFGFLFVFGETMYVELIMFGACKTKGGERIFRTVTADSFEVRANFIPATQLLNGNYAYFETAYDSGSSSKKKFYRISAYEAGHPDCTFFDRVWGRPAILDRSPSSWCVGAREISKITTRYKFVWNKTYESALWYVFPRRYSLNETKVIDTSAGRTIAHSGQVRMRGDALRNSLSVGGAYSKRCPNISNHATLFLRTIQPE